MRIGDEEADCIDTEGRTLRNAISTSDFCEHRSERAVAPRAIGKTLICLGDYPEARAAYEQTIRLTPFVRPEDLRQLAKCLYRMQQERTAAELEILANEKE